MPSLRPAADIAWTVEAGGVALRRAGAPGVLLAYPEAAAWDLLSRGMSSAQMVRLLAAIWATDEGDSANRLQALLRLWRHRGWIENGSACG